MIEMERLVLHRVCGGARSGPLQTHDFWASFRGDPLRFWASQLGGFFRKLKWLWEVKNERIRGLNRNLNDGCYFHKLEVILQLDSQLRNWIFKLRNGTRVPRRCFVAAKIFTT